jgi:hypothetical protein
MRHFASPDFWVAYRKLPEATRALADKNFALLKSEPRHPSLHFKRLVSGGRRVKGKGLGAGGQLCPRRCLFRLRYRPAIASFGRISKFGIINNEGAASRRGSRQQILTESGETIFNPIGIHIFSVRINGRVHRSHIALSPEASLP